jgi:cytochrome c peroxidase
LSPRPDEAGADAAPAGPGPAVTARHRIAAWLAVPAVIAAAALLSLAAAALADAGLPMRAWLGHPVDSLRLAFGENPHPVRLVLPPQAPLSALARVGQQLFFDRRLSGSGRLACASCHDPAHAHAPANALAVQIGGRDMDLAGTRAVPSLDYLYRQPSFSIGPDNEENENVDLQQLARAGQQAAHATKTATGTAASAQNLVPQGGIFWDGRADTLQQQASGPLFNPIEMDAGDPDRVAARIEQAGYGALFRQMFGAAIFSDPKQVVAEAMSAIGRYQFESPDFHAFTSKYDAWLQGRARLSRPELRGYLAFSDPQRGNCAACHLAQPTRDGLPPLFTDTQYEALGVPRNPAIPANHDARHADLGLCGPERSDLRDQTRYCGMFLTPSLRNTATRHAYFHNGVYRSLDQVLAFYAFRDVDPARIYPRGPGGRVEAYDDIPAAYRGNVDRSDLPFGGHPGEAPPMSERDRRDIVAFLGTLSDGYRAPP